MTSTGSRVIANPSASMKSLDGKVIYAAQCAWCHGEKREGIGCAPALQGHSFPVDQVIAIVTKGKGTMTAFESELSQAEIRAVARFIAKSK